MGAKLLCLSLQYYLIELVSTYNECPSYFFSPATRTIAGNPPLLDIIFFLFLFFSFLFLFLLDRTERNEKGGETEIHLQTYFAAGEVKPLNVGSRRYLNPRPCASLHMMK